MAMSEDRISNLPHPIIGHILSLLPPKDSVRTAVRTSVLSKQWRYLWTNTTLLHLDDSVAVTKDHPSDPNRWVDVIDSILSSFSLHSSPVSECFLCWPRHFTRLADLDRFILILVRSGVQKLTISSPGLDVDYYTIPPCLFECVTLAGLQIGMCRFPLHDPLTSNRWRNLRTLSLGHVTISHEGDGDGDQLFAQLISSCNCLETLRLVCCVGLSHLSVCSPSLTTLIISSPYRLRVCPERTPRLVRAHISILYDEDDCDYGDDLVQLVKHLAPLPLESLSLYLGFSLTKFSPKEAAVMVGMPHFLNLKMLEFQLHPRHSGAVSCFACLLRCFPHLEKLHVTIKNTPEEPTADIDFWDKESSFPCLTHHLKLVKIFRLDPSDDHNMGFLKYILASTPLLKEMHISNISFESNQVPIADICSSMKMASPNVKITTVFNR